MKRLLPLLACACNSILGIPEPSLTQGAPDAHAGPADARVTVKLTVSKDPTGTGQGSVTADAIGFTCDKDCASSDVALDPGVKINLAAMPAPGSFFLGWSGACAGIHRTCSVTLDAAKTVTASFAVNDHNLMFVTSQTMTGDFGGIAAADTLCDQDAKSAGLTGRFVAMMSDSSTNARDRFGTARGFVRMDGKPIADTVADLLTNLRIWYPVRFDENGDEQLAFIMTGTRTDGTVDTDTCSNWKSTSGQSKWASPSSGPGWLSDFPYLCSASTAILCVQVDKSAPLAAPAPATGKKIWVSNARFTPGGGGILAANSLCENEKPAGVASAKALLPTTQMPASALISPGALYVRPDGVPVALGSDFATMKMISAPWVHGDGTYAPTPCCILRAPGDFTAAPKSEDTCVNWSQNSASMHAFHMELQAYGFWDNNPLLNAAFNCSNSFLIMCVEAPQ